MMGNFSRDGLRWIDVVMRIPFFDFLRNFRRELILAFFIFADDSGHDYDPPGGAADRPLPGVLDVICMHCI
jgi:hypothetical protein